MKKNKKIMKILLTIIVNIVLLYHLHWVMFPKLESYKQTITNCEEQYYWFSWTDSSERCQTRAWIEVVISSGFLIVWSIFMTLLQKLDFIYDMKVILKKVMDFFRNR